MNIDRLGLRDHLLTVFTLDELTIVAHRLGVNYEQLGGKKHLDKTTSFIGLLDRHDRLAELLIELVRERPHLLAEYEYFLPPFIFRPPTSGVHTARRTRGEDEFS